MASIRSVLIKLITINTDLYKLKGQQAYKTIILNQATEYSWCSNLLAKHSTLQVASHLIPTTTQWSEYYYYPQIIEEKHETQGK